MIENKTVIYIAGYGRSGSTLLDAILGGSEGVTNTGELGSIFDELLEGNACSCGYCYETCERWSLFSAGISEADLVRFRDITRYIDSRHSLLRPHLKVLSAGQKELYRQAIGYVFNTISSPVVVDSTKTAQNGSFRPIALRDILGFDVKVIHLKRGFTSVLKSVSKGSNRKMLGKKDIRVKFLAQLGFQSKDPFFENNKNALGNMFRGAAGYFFANREAARLKSIFGDENFLRLDYETLLKNPIAVLSSIEEKFNVSLSDSKQVISDHGVFERGHIVGGNRMAQQDIIVRRPYR